MNNIEFSRDFVGAVITEPLADAMNQSSYDYPPDVSEFTETGMTPVKAEIVKAPLVGESPVNFECRLLRTLKYGRLPHISEFVIGRVVMIHVKDEYYLGHGAVDAIAWKPIGHLGVGRYCRLTDYFDLERKNLRDGVT